MDATRSGDSLRLEALGGLLEGEVDGLALLQAAEALHVQLALKEDSASTLLSDVW